MSIATELNRLTQAKADIKDELRKKGVNIPASAKLDTYDDYVKQVSSDYVADVTFIDYDGSVLYTYTKAEFALLTEMPANPTHTGLTSQGWNWTLADAQAYVASYGLLIIGQSYITNDEKTRVHLTIGADDPKSLTIYFYQANANGVTFDWGDNSATQTVAGTGNKTISHTYAAGTYTLTLNVTVGTIKIGHGGFVTAFVGGTNGAGKKCSDLVTSIELGGSIHTGGLMAGCFCSFNNLEYVTMPTGLVTINSSAFRTCCKLKGIVIPSTVTTFGSYVFFGSSSLTYASLPKALATIGANAFYAAHELKAAAIPPTVTSVTSAMFYYTGLKRLAIPSSVTSIDASLAQNTKLEEITIPSSVTSLGASCFYFCSNLRKVTLSPYITTIGNYEFDYCSALDSIELPSGITTIGDYAFYQDSNLVELTIPATVTSMGKNCLNTCLYLQKLIMLPTTPPTFGATMLSSTQSFLQIVVPAGKLNDYQTATGWSGYASKMVEAT